MDYKYRKFAVEILYEVNNNKGYSNILLEEYMKKMPNIRDRNLLNITVNGVIENKIFLDWIIKNLSTTKFSKISKRILEILRIGIYQIEFLDNISPKTVVYESVEEAKAERKKYLTRFVNGILRNYLRNREKINVKLEKLENDEYLSIKYSFPMSFIKKLKKEFPYKDIILILKSLNRKPKFTIRVNSTLITRNELIKILEEKKIKIEETKFSSLGINVLNSDFINIKDLYDQGLFSIQGESSMIAVELLDPKPGSKILDMCSAPGGKGLYSAELMNNTGEVDCREIYINKINTINNQIKRLRLDNVDTKVEDATIFNEENLGKYDYCIVDVPCSNSGIIMKKPEIKYKTNFENLDNLKEKQLQILINAGKYLKPGGEMVYSTCSIFSEENIEIVNEFLKTKNEFSLIDLDSKYSIIDKNYKKGYLNIYPHVSDLDGFFIAKIKKTKI
jgi:16S rRNA (cytosine967-C5)-methyltransferase